MAVNKVIYGNNTLVDLTNDSATEAVVFEGATFHGSDGEVKTGTFTISEEITEQDSLIEQIKNALQGKAVGGSVELPELTNPGTAADLVEGKELIDGDGNKVTGTIKVPRGGISVEVEPIYVPMGSNSKVQFGYQPKEPAYISPSTGGVNLQSPLTNFGDATAEDVAKGKTFTSAAGLLVVGTKEESGAGDPDLPTGYRRTDFIRFNDAQIIDTGVICNQNTKIKAVFTREVSTAMYMYGVLSDGNTATVTAYLTSGGAWRFGNKSVSITVSVSDDIIHTSIVSNSGIESDTGTNTYTSVSDFETIGTLTIGATRNASGTVAAAQYIGKIFLFEMWQGDEQVLKLVPVTDGTVYRFWDTVSQSFFDSITDTALEGGNL